MRFVLRIVRAARRGTTADSAGELGSLRRLVATPALAIAKLSCAAAGLCRCPADQPRGARERPPAGPDPFRLAYIRAWERGCPKISVRSRRRKTDAAAAKERETPRRPRPKSH
ncbi:hypothetical protein HPB47_005724 [Ixodes persulcatus]|uniref:Uncharacterized protein n=1 Tax=Ixodes persulcatus TaxID=34615 RepID=A0AC60PD08_IXOPE|nr:hypothetical protein HPB47_005724 [Ixodes persulcatus]